MTEDSRRIRRAISRRALLGALAVLTIGAAGCADDAHMPRLEPLDAVVGLRSSGCFKVSRGTGAIVDHGLVLTSAHVVAGGTEIEVIDADGAVHPGTVVHLDPNADLALLAVDGVPERGLAVSTVKAPRGQVGTVLLPTTDADGAPTDPPGHVSVDVELLRPVTIQTEDIYIDTDVERDGYEVRSEIVAGDSGAPVLVGREIVAIIWARSTVADDRAWAVNVSSIRTQIENPATRSIPPDTRCP